MEPQYYSSLTTSSEIKFIELVNTVNNKVLVNANNILYLSDEREPVIKLNNCTLNVKDSYIEIKKKLGLE